MNGLRLLGGITFLLFGLSLMRGRMEKLWGHGLDRKMQAKHQTPVQSFCTGVGLSGMLQSTVKTTELLIGLVNSGLLEERRAQLFLLGGTCGGVPLVALLSWYGLPELEGWYALGDIRGFSLLAALMGGFLLSTEKKRARDTGILLLGFGVFIGGMVLLTEAGRFLAGMAESDVLLQVFHNPALGILTGIAVAALLHSAIAAIALLQALSITGLFSLSTAGPLILGFLLGECIVTWFIAVGAGIPARRLAVVLTASALVSTLLGGLFFSIWNQMRDPMLPAAPWGIALAYGMVVLPSALLLALLLPPLSGLLHRALPGAAAADPHILLDPRIFSVPSVAVAACFQLTIKMSGLARAAVLAAVDLLHLYTKRGEDLVLEAEEDLDLYEDELGGYLLQLSGRELSAPDSKRVSELLRVVGNFERMGDHAVNILESAQTLRDRGGGFSQEGQREVSVLLSALTEIVTISDRAFAQEDTQLARKVEPLEQVIDALVFTLKKNHTNRLQTGVCNIAVGAVLADLLTDLERVSDHCSNVAVAIIETEGHGFALHDYLNTLKFSGNPDYTADFQAYLEKYQLPS